MPCLGQLVRVLTITLPSLSNWAYDTQRETSVKETQTEPLISNP